MSPKLYAYLARIDPKKQEYKITPLSLLRTSLALGISAGSNIYVEDAAAELVQDVLGIESPIVTDMATYISIVGQTIVNTIILDGVMRSVDKMFHVYLPYITDRFNAIRNSRAYQDIATQRSPFSTGKIINDTAKVTSSLSVATVFVLVAYYELKYGNYENASEAVLLALSLPVFFTEGSEAYQGYEELIDLYYHMGFMSKNLFQRTKIHFAQGDLPKNQFVNLRSGNKVSLDKLSISTGVALQLYDLNVMHARLSFLNKTGQKEIGGLFRKFTAIPVISNKAYATQVLYFKDALEGMLPTPIYTTIAEHNDFLGNMVPRYQEILRTQSLATSFRTTLERNVIAPYRRNYTAQSWVFLLGNNATSVYMLGYLQNFTENFKLLSGEPLTGSFYEWDWTADVIGLFFVSLIPFFLLTFLNFGAFGSVARPSEYSTRKITTAVYPLLSFLGEFTSLILANASAVPFSLGRRLVDTRSPDSIEQVDALAIGGYTTGWVAYFASYVFLWYYLRLVMSILLSILLEKQCDSSSRISLSSEQIEFVHISKCLEKLINDIAAVSAEEEIDPSNLPTIGIEGVGYQQEEVPNNQAMSGQEVLEEYMTEPVTTSQGVQTTRGKKLCGLAWQLYTRKGEDLPLNKMETVLPMDKYPQYTEDDYRPMRSSIV